MKTQENDWTALEASQQARQEDLAERVGFEPTVPLRGHSLSRRARSAAPAPLRACRLLKDWFDRRKAIQGRRLTCDGTFCN